MIDSLVKKFLTESYYLKMGNGNLAKRWRCSEQEVKEARDRAKKIIKENTKAEVGNYSASLEEDIIKQVDNEKGTLKSEVHCNFEPKNDTELAELHKIDLSKYKISTYWSKMKSNGKFTSSVLCTLIKPTDQLFFQSNFEDFLKEYIPSKTRVASSPFDLSKDTGCLILPKQDAHFNKFDVDEKNDIDLRFVSNLIATRAIVNRAKETTNLEEIVYIVGSDEFNSEWTGLTTKGTPQVNILTYQDAFEAICNHEVEIINDLALKCKTLRVLYIPGNHDEYVGWHLISWLKTYFRNSDNMIFDALVDNTKYLRYSNTAMMFNHGDDMKPKDLANKFPIGFKEEWSKCQNFYIFTGDKHTEQVVDISTIKIFRVPQLSTSRGKWDDKRGFENKAEMTGFIIRKDDGMTDTLREPIRS